MPGDLLSGTLIEIARYLREKRVSARELEQPLPLQIDPEVIDAAAHLSERYLSLQDERWARRLRTCHGRLDQDRRQKDRPPQHAQLFAILICASAAFSPSASFFASSLAQKCIK
jgi:hypothetical protein